MGVDALLETVDVTTSSSEFGSNRGGGDFSTLLPILRMIRGVTRLAVIELPLKTDGLSSSSVTTKILNYNKI